jgi:flavin-dependent dehydrogenase
MGDAKKVFDWLAVSVDSFGQKNLNPAENLISIGDAGAFIDPFTGSGMLMALESSEILAEVLAENLSFKKVAEKYKMLHREKFRKRLRVCSVMRRLAFIPTLTDLAISCMSFGKKPREMLARATRSA